MLLPERVKPSVSLKIVGLRRALVLPWAVPFMVFMLVPLFSLALPCFCG